MYLFKGEFYNKVRLNAFESCTGRISKYMIKLNLQGTNSKLKRVQNRIRNVQGTENSDRMMLEIEESQVHWFIMKL